MTVVDTRVQGPQWPEAAGRSLLFLIDASSRTERRLLRGWVERNRPGHVAASDVEVASIPRTRRRKAGDWKLNPHLHQRLQRGDDPLVVPLRVIWQPADRDGDRAVRWLDLLKLGDPRDPDWLRQRYLLWRHPDRCRIVAAEPAPLSDLDRDWHERTGDGDHANIVEYVSLQASLALERAERQVRGNRYKVPAFVRQDLLTKQWVVSGMPELADETGVTADRAMLKAARYVKEIAATHSPYVIDLMAHSIRLLIRRAYGEELRYDRAELADIYELGQRHSLVFLPSHKSNLDHLALQLALYENGLPPNHTAAGINMNFFPVGPLVRRSGAFFIRRTFKDNPIYKFVLQSYIRYLVEKRFTLEWYIEGGRSRSGKLRSPRFGLLGYVFDAYRDGASDDVYLVPVSIAYDQIQDVRGYARELAGGAKQQESFGALIDFVRSLRKRHGAIHLRFGEPVSIRAEAGPPAAAHGLDPDERNLQVQKLAFEVSARINRATPITPISLMTLALLGARGRALSVEQTLHELEHYLNYLKRRELPTTDELRLDTPERVREALDALVDHGVVTRHTGGHETVYAINPGSHLIASYYRNTIIHFFVNGAIAELALAGAGDREPDLREEEFWQQTLQLRDLLKFEFFFRSKAEFAADIEEDLDIHDPLWRKRLAAGDTDALLRDVRPLMSPWILRPFIEAYWVVAEVIAALPADAAVDEKPTLASALALGQQYLLQQRIASAESVSMDLFKSALKLAANRGATEPGPTAAPRRQAFAAEMRAVVSRVGRIDAISTARRSDPSA